MKLALPKDQLKSVFGNSEPFWICGFYNSATKVLSKQTNSDSKDPNADIVHNWLYTLLYSTPKPKSNTQGQGTMFFSLHHLYLDKYRQTNIFPPLLNDVTEIFDEINRKHGYLVGFIALISIYQTSIGIVKKYDCANTFITYLEKAPSVIVATKPSEYVNVCWNLRACLKTASTLVPPKFQDPKFHEISIWKITRISNKKRGQFNGSNTNTFEQGSDVNTSEQQSNTNTNNSEQEPDANTDTCERDSDANADTCEQDPDTNANTIQRVHGVTHTSNTPYSNGGTRGRGGMRGRGGIRGRGGMRAHRPSNFVRSNTNSNASTKNRSTPNHNK
ncbi:MAG: hypothetical protein QXW79_00275 [Thermoplasmata archaeon]